MSEIEVGEYVRTKNGQIDIFKENDENYMFARCEKKTYWKLDIVKHKKNIIDLIKVGDVLELQEDDAIFYIGIKKDMTTLSYSDIKEKIRNKEVKLLSILTQEQFENVSYKVGD